MPPSNDPVIFLVAVSVVVLTGVGQDELTGAAVTVGVLVGLVVAVLVGATVAVAVGVGVPVGTVPAGAVTVTSSKDADAVVVTRPTRPALRVRPVASPTSAPST
ncbi:hypothetical protein ACWKSP_01740 [Micromonosporaceae bacterium Da 78-11]